MVNTITSCPSLISNSRQFFVHVGFPHLRYTFTVLHLWFIAYHCHNLNDEIHQFWQCNKLSVVRTLHRDAVCKIHCVGNFKMFHYVVRTFRGFVWLCNSLLLRNSFNLVGYEVVEKWSCRSILLIKNFPSSHCWYFFFYMLRTFNASLQIHDYSHGSSVSEGGFQNVISLAAYACTCAYWNMSSILLALVACMYCARFCVPQLLLNVQGIRQLPVEFISDCFHLQFTWCPFHASNTSSWIMMYESGIQAMHV